MGKANTSVVYVAGRVLATEEADVPYQVTLPDLGTVGRFDFNGGLGTTLVLILKWIQTRGRWLLLGTTPASEALGIISRF